VLKVTILSTVTLILQIKPLKSVDTIRGHYKDVRGGSAWTPGGSCMAGWSDDAPLMGNWDPRAWLLVLVGATPVPLGWAVGVVCGAMSCGRHAP
jgi:hypothetical protein